MCQLCQILTVLLTLAVKAGTSINRPPLAGTTTTQQTNPVVTHPDDHYADITVKFMNDAHTCDQPGVVKMIYEIGPRDGMYVQAWHEPSNRTVALRSCRISVRSGMTNDSLLYEFFGDQNYIDCGGDNSLSTKLNLYDSINALRPFKTFNCNTSFDESNFIESGVLVIELENPGNHTTFDFSLYIQDGEIRQDHTSHRHLGVPGIVGICVAVGIVLVAAAIVVIMTYTKKGIRVPRGGGAVTYNQIYDDSTLAMDPIETEMVSNPMSNT